MLLDIDPDLFLEDHGLPCQSGGIDFQGIKDEPDDDLSVAGFNAQTSMTTLLVKTSVVIAANIKMGTTIVVDGVPYFSRLPKRVDDGVFSLIPLTKS